MAPESRSPGALGFVRRHPVIVGTLVGCTLLGAALGGFGLTEEWSVARRIAAGALGGAGCGLLMTGTKWIG